jgi:hypothetical protein
MTARTRKGHDHGQEPTRPRQRNGMTAAGGSAGAMSGPPQLKSLKK